MKNSKLTKVTLELELSEEQLESLKSIRDIMPQDGKVQITLGQNSFVACNASFIACNAAFTTHKAAFIACNAAFTK